MTMAFALPQVEIMWNGQTPNAIEFQDFEPLDGGEDLLLQPLSPGSFASLQLSPVSLFEQQECWRLVSSPASPRFGVTGTACTNA
eukprot:m.89645 g.89645  ORF g.89645 m.89645 type:complete len:85 (+) comp51053_c0_seq3:634-888(+)